MRLLIVSPHFPPTNAADMQRVRLFLPYLRVYGVEAKVLCVESDQVAAPQDTWLAAGLPQDVVVHRVEALDLKWGRLPGLGSLTFRALGALRRRGDEVLGRGRELSEVGGQRTEDRGQEEKCPQVLPLTSDLRPPTSAPFDLIYFSTTQFGIHVLGPRWKKKFGVPFVMDYQDPWVSDYYREHPEVVPPGGRLKYGLASWINRRQEPRVLRECSGITSVSAAYPEQLAKRYAWLKIGDQGTGDGGQGSAQRRTPVSCNPSPASLGLSPVSCDLSPHPLPSLVLPFPGDARDFERVRQESIRQTVFDPNDGLKHWVYVGRGGADMALACRALFAAVAEVRSQESGDRGQKDKAEGRLLEIPADRAGSSPPDSCLPSPAPCSLNSLRLHFIGTSYAAAGQGGKTIEPLAREFGLEGIVSEHPDRIPYSETLRCLLDADALIIPGSDDPGYTASKIYPYLLAEKPLLAVFHEQSSVVSLIQEVGGGTVVPFSTGEAPESIGARIGSEWLATGGPDQAVPLDQAAFAPYTAREQAKQLAAFFKGVLGRPPTSDL